MDESDSMPFYMMEYIPNNLADNLGIGESTRIRKGQMSGQKLFSITRQVLKARKFLPKNDKTLQSSLTFTRQSYGIFQIKGDSSNLTSGHFVRCHI